MASDKTDKKVERKVDQSEKDKALDAALSQIQKQFGKGAIMKLGDKGAQMNVEAISTGSISLDVATGIGGVPRGRIVEIYGPESSGKTTLTLHIVAEAQKNGGKAAFIDAEHALDPVYAKNLGVDVENLLVSQPDTGEQALEICDMLVRSGALDVVIIDSVAALVPKAEIQGEMGDAHVGLQARLMSQANMVGLIPVGFSTAAYEEILEDSQFWHSFLISVERVVLALIINFVLIVLMAYPLSKTNAQFRGRNIYANLMIFAMLFNGGMIPTFLVVKSYGLLNTVWALVLPGAVPIFNVILVMNFFAAVPKELEEAAFIDGANPLQVLTKIFIPISKPVLATVSLFSIVGSWNDFYSGLIYMSKAAYYPLMTYIQSLQINVEDLIKQGNLSAVVDSAALGNTNLNAAKIVVAVIPLLLIYPLLQRYFVSGIVVGSVKG